MVTLMKVLHKKRKSQDTFFTRYAFNEWLKPIFLVNTITKQYDKTIYSITITVFLLKTVSLFY